MVLSSAARAALPGFALALFVIGCGSLPNVTLPVKPVTPASSAPLGGPEPTSPVGHEQVVTAYLGYWQAYGTALRTRNMASARGLLAQFADAGFLKQVTAPLSKVWAAREIGYGYAIPHVLGVTTKGNSATLHDCLDLSHLGVQDSKTGLVVPGSFGLPEVDFYVTLTRKAGHWVVSNMQQVEVPCTP
jgi:hypothetical protein